MLTDYRRFGVNVERDADAMSEALARHDALVEDAVLAANGDLVRAKVRVAPTFSVFAHPRDAVIAAAGLQRLVSGEQWSTAVPLRVRAGV